MTIKYTASVITSTAITDAMLVSCTVPEPALGETLWVSGATYAVNAEVILTSLHKKYRRAIAGAGTIAPNLDTANWVDIGATLRWAQFDRKIGTRTIAATSLTTVLAPGSAEGIALLDLVGYSVTVSCTDAPGGVTIYSRTFELDGSIVNDVYDWMFNPLVQRVNLVLTDLPGQFPSARITVAITGPTAGVGALVVGRSLPIGAVLYGAGAGLINYGKVKDDGFGNREWIEGGYSSRVTMPILLEQADFSAVYRSLVALRSTPAVYIGSEIQSLDPLICYGVFKDLYMTISNFSVCNYNLEIEGLNNS